MKITFFVGLVLVFVILSQISFAKTDFDRFKDKFNTEYEIATCTTSYYHINNGTLEKFKIKDTSGIFKGTKMYVEFRCRYKYNTIIHTHTNGYCIPSEIDLNFIKNSKTITTSVIYCGNNQTLVLIKKGNEILQYHV